MNIISNPVNSTVPIAAEVMKKAGVYDPKKIMVRSLPSSPTYASCVERRAVSCSCIIAPLHHRSSKFGES